MIAWLRGRLRDRREGGYAVLDVGGVGYLVQLPTGVAADAPLGAEVELHVHTVVREDALLLFGFDDPVALRVFEVLLTVSGVGPKVALAILSTLPPGDLVAAVETGDVARIRKAHGVGKRLAERLAVELRGKLDKIPGLVPTDGAATGGAVRPRRGLEGRVWADLRSALGNLQFRPKEVDAVVESLRAAAPPPPAPEPAFDGLLRAALRELRTP